MAYSFSYGNGESDSAYYTLANFEKHHKLLRGADKPTPVVDDTFSDDTMVQTFGVLENMRKIICLKCD